MRRQQWWATLSAQDQAQAGLTHIQQGVAVCQTLGAHQLHPWAFAMLAVCYARLGQPAAGLTALADIAALMATTDDVCYAAEIARPRAACAFKRGHRTAPWGSAAASTAAAEQCFHQALAVARHQQARCWELRATMRLSRLWQQQGKQAAARALLVPMYAWFPEGLDTTPDLREAKALLEELAG